MLVASDAMARGMDVESVDTVVNYDAPVYAKVPAPQPLALPSVARHSPLTQASSYMCFRVHTIWLATLITLNFPVVFAPGECA